VVHTELIHKKTIGDSSVSITAVVQIICNAASSLKRQR